MDWENYGVPVLLRMQYWIRYAWPWLLPAVYWLVLYWTRCKKQDLRTMLQLMLLSAIPLCIVFAGLGMSNVCFLEPYADMLQGLRDAIVIVQLTVVCLTVGALVGGLLTRATRGWRAFVLAGAVGGWCLLWLAHLRILLWLLGR